MILVLEVLEDSKQDTQLLRVTRKIRERPKDGGKGERKIKTREIWERNWARDAERNIIGDSYGVIKVNSDIFLGWGNLGKLLKICFMEVQFTCNKRHQCLVLILICLTNYGITGPSLLWRYRIFPPNVLSCSFTLKLLPCVLGLGLTLAENSLLYDIFRMQN